MNDYKHQFRFIFTSTSISTRRKNSKHTRKWPRRPTTQWYMLQLGLRLGTESKRHSPTCTSAQFRARVHVSQREALQAHGAEECNDGHDMHSFLFFCLVGHAKYDVTEGRWWPVRVATYAEECSLFSSINFEAGFWMSSLPIFKHTLDKHRD